MKSLTFVLGSILAAQASATGFINSIYYDEWHTTQLPSANITAGINVVYLAFVNPSELITNPIGDYTPFVSVSSIKQQFGSNTKVLISVGGWSWSAPFAFAAANATARELFAKNVATMLKNTGADGVDIDWEYPGGNGADYKIIPNASKLSEIKTYPLLLAAVRKEIGRKSLLTIAVPGLKRDMIAYTKETIPKIAASVDYFNIMSYDLMNRRDNVTKHHTGVAGSLDAVDQYLSLGLDPKKAVLGFAFYAKWFTTDPKSNCATQPLGCATVAMEDALGNDNGLSGAITFETANMVDAPIPANLTVDPNGSCGASVGFKCQEGYCCSQYGYCGNTPDYCGAACVHGFGDCTGESITDAWKKARENGISDASGGGQYYWDSAANIFWTWDTPAFIAEKFSKIVKDRCLGGIMSWSLAQDSYNNEHLLAIQQGVRNVTSRTSKVHQRQLHH